MIKQLILSALILVSFSGLAQNLTRIEADFSLKEKDILGNKKLSVGKVYFDKTERQIIFNITFPYEETLCVTDSGIYRFKSDTLFQFIKADGLVDINIFNFFLNGKLDFYGLKESPFELEKIEKEDGMVISTWLPPLKFKERNGKMILSQIDKKIFGLVTYTPDGEIASKQFFEEYLKFQNYEFPTSIIQYIYIGNEKEVKISNYRNIKINNYESDENYSYPIPVN